MNRLQSYYQNVYKRDSLLKTDSQNINQVPTFSKIILNTSIKATLQDKKKIASTFIALEMISGQKTKKTRSKNFIASFKLRKDQLIGCKVTLRGKELFFFLEKLIYVILPKIRDFNGFQVLSLDQKGNLSFGLQNILLFPELENHYELFESLNGLQITLVLNAKNKERALNLLSAFQIPFFGETKEKQISTKNISTEIGEKIG